MSSPNRTDTSTITWFKKRAKRWKKAMDGEVSHSYALHVTAQAAGFGDWNALINATEEERETAIVQLRSGGQ